MENPSSAVAAPLSAAAIHDQDNGDDADLEDTEPQNEQPHNKRSPILRIGMVADIQYADVEDGFSWSGNARFYRHALDSAAAAARHFQAAGVDVVVNLGDTVDGKADRDVVQLDAVIHALHNTYSHGKILHVYGNHCLYNANRQTLAEKLAIPMTVEADSDGELVGYYSHVVGNIKLVVIDSYDICYLRDKHSAKHIAAVEILQLHKGENYQKDTVNSPDGLRGLARRFVAFNGAVGPTQLAWLQAELQATRESCDSQKVIILSHQPILPDTTHPVCLIWNYQQVLDILKEYNDVVVASFAGHTHGYGYQQWHGIHFRVLEAVLETPPPHHTYCIVDIYDEDGLLRVNGYGRCKSADYRYEPSSSSTTKTKEV
jgi:manganese-dependent ADP-ribose/CDP-alcohol diphosphatase